MKSIDGLEGALITICQLLEILMDRRSTVVDFALAEMDLADHAFAGELGIIHESIGYTPGETYGGDPGDE